VSLAGVRACTGSYWAVQGVFSALLLAVALYAAVRAYRRPMSDVQQVRETRDRRPSVLTGVSCWQKLAPGVPVPFSDEPVHLGVLQIAVGIFISLSAGYSVGVLGARRSFSAVLSLTRCVCVLVQGSTHRTSWAMSCGHIWPTSGGAQPLPSFLCVLVRVATGN
jgi:hypothetical protein